ncbi:hypothetical protein EYF80_023126 [Liparis tanakae]|uniref:Uncharacterized protein n=1 Tax=Liparis tanakae TaxID=230148 RepID=A0A4Z2HP88_9TELE|nr:hypothetical protein EYF80_023126 [Liparis tanakae]
MQRTAMRVWMKPKKAMAGSIPVLLGAGALKQTGALKQARTLKQTRTLGRVLLAWRTFRHLDISFHSSEPPSATFLSFFAFVFTVCSSFTSGSSSFTSGLGSAFSSFSFSPFSVLDETPACPRESEAPLLSSRQSLRVLREH